MRFTDSGETTSKERIIFVIGIIAAATVFYSIYLFSLQVIRGSEFKKRAEEVARRVIEIEPQRGEIYDRNYDVPLVLNIDSFAVDLIPGELEENRLNQTLLDLSRILEIDVSKIQGKIPKNYKQVFTPLEIRDGVSYAKIVEIAENINHYPGVDWHQKQTRSYLETGTIAHAIGYVGTITREELQVLYNKGYNQNSVIGKSGIEKHYDQVLRGKAGRLFTTVDVRGRSISDSGIDYIEPEPGKNIVLTIDRDIQELCEKALGKRNGSVIVSRPATGEVLAMVSYPWYDQNLFYIADGPVKFRELSLDPSFPFLNRAIQSSYSPASMFKIIMTAGLVEEEAMPIDRKVICEGEMFFGDRMFHCHRRWGHGAMDLFSGLAESCNVYFWTAGQELGIEPIVNYSRQFGLGEITGIDLPGEVKGILPSPAWKEEVYNARWLGGDTMNVSIGQGYLTVTPIQVANMISMIVNEGVVYRPHLLSQIRDPISGNIIEELEPEVLRTSTISRETFKTVQEAMRKVITEGTAAAVINTPSVQIAGKTGTGQMGFEDRWSSWFSAYGPYDAASKEDTIAVVVMVEGTNEWEWWAPKAANIIFQGIFADQTYDEAVTALNLWYATPESPPVGEPAEQ